MNVLLWILLGAISGWVAGLVMKSDHSTIEDIVLGIVGASVGGFLFNMLGQPGVTGFNLYSMLVAVVGAALIIFIVRKLRR